MSFNQSSVRCRTHLAATVYTHKGDTRNHIRLTVKSINNKHSVARPQRMGTQINSAASSFSKKKGVFVEHGRDLWDERGSLQHP